MGELSAQSFCTAAFMAYNTEYALAGFVEFKWFSSDNRFLKPPIQLEQNTCKWSEELEVLFLIAESLFRTRCVPYMTAAIDAAEAEREQGVLLWVNRGGLSLTSVSVTVTEVVPERPPIWPTMSLAWMTRTYWSLVSRSMLGRAVLMTPEEREGGREGEKDALSQTYCTHRFTQEPVYQQLRADNKHDVTLNLSG